MCGIIAYSGSDNAVPYLIEGTKELEYRGYDSFGCAIECDGKIIVDKGTGAVSQIIDSHSITSYASNRGLSHTRWATHGRISKKNAHPISDCSESIVVVHNGIIENWKELKKELDGHSFVSDTDTEVIPHLIEESMKNGLGLREAVEYVGHRLEGASSFVVMVKNIDSIVAFKGGSPLVMAIGKNGNFVSSDIPSILKYTNRIVYLHDGDIVSFNASSFEIKNTLNPNINHNISVVDLETETVKKGNFSYYMEKEIAEQPLLWKNMESYSSKKLTKAASIIRKAKRVYLVASGTSFHASKFGAMMLRNSGIDAQAIQPQDYEYYSEVVSPQDIFVLISQSGETADIISILPDIKDNTKIGIVNVEGSHIALEVDLLLEMSAGVEKGVAATKTMTNTLLILSLLSCSVSNNLETCLSELKILNKRIYEFLVPSVDESISKIAGILSENGDVYFVGKGYGYVLAQEGALKMKEISYIHAESIDLATIKHGPLALITNGTKVVAIVANGSMKDSTYNLEELKARGAYIIGISESRSFTYDKFIRVPAVNAFSFAPILMSLQMLAFKVAVKRGLDPDRPRNLAKSVTVR